MMVGLLAHAAGVEAIDAAIEIGKARSKLESVFDEHRADRILSRVVRAALQSKHPITAVEQNVKFIVACAMAAATKTLILNPNAAENMRKRRARHYASGRRTKS